MIDHYPTMHGDILPLILQKELLAPAGISRLFLLHLSSLRMFINSGGEGINHHVNQHIRYGATGALCGYLNLFVE